MNDLISRQAAIDKLNERQRKLIYCFGFENDAVKIMDIAKSIIIATPSTEPERESAEWVKNDNGTYSCSKCQSWIPKEQRHYARFCLHCGSKMERRTDE